MNRPQIQTEDILKMNLSIAERLILVEDLWDSIVADSGQLPLTESQKKFLDAELEDYKQNPKSGSSWEEVKSDIKKLHAKIYNQAKS